MSEPEVETTVHYFFHGVPLSIDHIVLSKNPLRVTPHPQCYGFIFEDHIAVEVDHEGAEQHLCTHVFSPAYFLGERLGPQQIRERASADEAEALLHWMRMVMEEDVVRTPMGTYVSPRHVLEDYFDEGTDVSEIEIEVLPPDSFSVYVPDYVPDDFR